MSHKHRPKANCKRCGKLRSIKSRHLCYACATTPGVLEQYPPSTAFGAYRSDVATCKLKLPDEPCTAPPGSEEKIAVMEARASRGEYVFHENDRTSLLTFAERLLR